MINITEEQLVKYIHLFSGRKDVYAKRWEKGQKSGYSPAYEFDWSEFMSHKAKGGSINTFENKRQLPLTKEIIKNHLLGKYAIGIYPLLEDNSCNLIAADFDKKEWKTDSKSFIDTCTKYGLHCYLERSRSGNGAHAWIFFEEAQKAQTVRRIIFEILREALNISEFEKEISFDRLFPNQDTLPLGGFGNLIALPLNGKSMKNGNTAFLDTRSFIPFEDQFAFLESIQRVPSNKIDQLYSELIDSPVYSVKIENVRSSDILKITLDEQLYIDRNEIPQKMKIFLRDNLNFHNSEYIIKKRLGKSVYKLERFFKLIAEEDDKVIIPRGFLKELEDYCQENGIDYRIKDLRKQREPLKFKEDIKLYDYQQSAFDVTKNNDFGVIVAPPGAGKTVLGLKIIAEKKQPALILVHRKQLLDQWKERIQSFLKIPKKDIGEISGSKKKIGKQITIGMVQTFTRMDDFSDYKDRFGIIIVDECHHIPAKSFRETIIKFKPYYLYGLTATPKRKNNDEKLIYVYIGEILHTIDKEYKEELNLGDVEVVIKDTDLRMPFKFTTDNFQLLAKIISFDTHRNQMISKDALDQVKVGRKVLILSDRKSHIDVLNQYIKGSCETIIQTGDDSVSMRKSKLEQIDLGHFQVLLATGQLFGEGMDIKHLDTLILAFPFSFEGKLIQYIGRIQRSNSKKIVFDYRDKEIPFLERMFKKRNKYYKGLKR